MRPGDKANPGSLPPPVPPEPADEAPGVPGLHSWPAVYWFAFAVFVAVVVALAIFSRVYA
jgi:hypothetical protein